MPDPNADRSPGFRRGWKLLTGFLVIFAGLPVAALADNEDADSKKKKTETSSTMQTLDILALNQKSTGIVLPEFDESGNPAGKITAASATRTGEDTLELTSMRIDFPSETGDNITIDLPAATFNLKTSTLIGTRDVVITRIDFILTGDRLEFNTKTRESVLFGNIKMLIHERKATTSQPAEAP